MFKIVGIRISFSAFHSTLPGRVAPHVSSGLASPERFAKARLHPIRANPLPDQRLADALLKHAGIFGLSGILSLIGRVFCLKKELLHFFLPSLTKNHLDKVGLSLNRNFDSISFRVEDDTFIVSISCRSGLTYNLIAIVTQSLCQCIDTFPGIY